MAPSLEDTLTMLEQKLRDEFAGIHLEFTRQIFAKHVELWIYVLNLTEYPKIVERCNILVKEYDLDNRSPEIWLLPQTWTGPWPGGQSEQALRERREAFKRQHATRVG